MARYRLEPLIQLPAQIAYRLRALGYFLLAPPVGDRTQNGDQRGRSGQNDPLVETLFDQAGLVFLGDAEKTLARKKHDDKIGGAGKLVPIRLRTQARHVVLNLADMPFQMRSPVVLGLGVP